MQIVERTSSVIARFRWAIGWQQRGSEERMDGMLGKDTRFIEGFATGLWQANCYVIGDVEIGSAVVVDPGQDGGPTVRQRLDARDVRCEAILLTHGHLDHLWAVPELARDLDVPVLLHPDDRWLWDDPAAGIGMSTAMVRDQLGLDWDPPTEHLDAVEDRQRLSFAGLPLTVRHTPGHTPGSVVYLIDDVDAAGEATGQVGGADSLLLSGDLIFNGSVGRTDFPRGSWEQQMESLSRIVLPLEDRTLILSGHGPETTVGAERRANPFLRQLA